MQVRCFGRYTVDDELGRGTMGVVYRGHDPVIDRPVAIKTVLLPESIPSEERKRFHERFLLEARIAGKLIHPNVVVTYDAETDEATQVPFIAMELVEGTSLAQILAHRGKLPWEEAVSIAIPLALALDHAHQQGIVHRDIKPANVIISTQGIPKLVDFGIAKLPSAELTQTGVVIGTPHFMSPEQLRGEKLDGRSDLFSLASMLYKLVTGDLPFRGSELATIVTQVMYKIPVPLSARAPDIPPYLDGVVARGLMKTPDDRYLSGAEFAQDMIAIKAGSTPRRAVTLGERTQMTALATPSGVYRAEYPLPPLPTTTPISKFGGFVRKSVRVAKKKLWRLTVRRIVAIVALLSVAVFFGYRNKIVNRELTDAQSAIENGDLVASERLLEALVQANPELEEASDLLLATSVELIHPMLPEELLAKHDHRLGSCTGELVLHEWGLEYRSAQHEEWKWRFENIRAIELRGTSDVSLETHEGDLMGLLGTKNYNFVLLSDPLDEVLWRRFGRLYERRRAGPGASVRSKP